MMKQELGWADWQVRTDRAIRRHWALVCCAFPSNGGPGVVPPMARRCPRARPPPSNRCR